MSLRSKRPWRDFDAVYVTCAIVVIVALYLFAAVTTFKLRHQWMTDEQISTHLTHALRWQRIDQ